MQLLAEEFRAGRFRALARAITLVENRAEGSEALMEELTAGPSPGGWRIGFTGPPGVGKSTLVREVAREVVKAGGKAGILAVDPSSPRTGGALLGDRIRMAGVDEPARVFFRSMASGGISGGLAPPAREILDLMESFGFSHLLIETVGAGQAELEVSRAADSVVVVVMPGQGDAVQAMKGGILEVADVLVVNKSDLPGAEEAGRILRDGLSLFEGDGGGWRPPVVLTSAERGGGTGALLAAVGTHRSHMEAVGELDRRRDERIRARIRDVLRRDALAHIETRLASPFLEERDLEEVRAGRETPYSLARRLGEVRGGGGPVRPPDVTK